MRITHLVTFALVFFLAACSSLSTEQKAMEKRTYHQQIEMAGRLSVHYEHNHQPQALHLHFDWVQIEQEIEIALSFPTGQTVATLLINDHGAQLNQPGKPAQFAHDANQLILDTLGWPLPVDHLRDWLQGFLDPEHQYLAPHEKGTYFVGHHSWSLSYPSWEKENKSERPKRLDIEITTEQAGQVSLRIVIDKWNPQ